MTNLLIDKLKNSHLIRVENKEVLDTLHVIQVKDEDMFEKVPLTDFLGDVLNDFSFNPPGKSYEGQLEKIEVFQDE